MNIEAARLVLFTIVSPIVAAFLAKNWGLVGHFLPSFNARRGSWPRLADAAVALAWVRLGDYAAAIE